MQSRQQLSRASALGPWWTWCAATSRSASASSTARPGSSWRDGHSGQDRLQPYPRGQQQQTGKAPWNSDCRPIVIQDNCLVEWQATIIRLRKIHTFFQRAGYSVFTSLRAQLKSPEITKNFYLLHLELDGGLEVKDLGIEVVRVSHQGGELSCLQDIASIMCL